MAHVVKHAVVDGLANVAHRPFGIGGGDDLVCAGRVLVGGEDANFPPSHLLFVDVHRLQTEDTTKDADSRSTGSITPKDHREQSFCVTDLRDVVDGRLHAAELRRLDVKHLQDIVGQRVDQVGNAGQRLCSVVLGLLQRPVLVWRLNKTKKVASVDQKGESTDYYSDGLLIFQPLKSNSWCFQPLTWKF